MKRPSALKAPFLKRISMLDEKVDADEFPFNRLEFLRQADFSLEFSSRVTFFVGENGTGKSTLLEAIAELCDFPAGGGSHDHPGSTEKALPGSRLAKALRPSWLPRVRSGFYLRAESFYNLAGFLDRTGTIERSGGRKLHAQSHGESVLALLSNRLGSMERGIILLDEPEAALSPSRQLAFLRLLCRWDRSKSVQLIIATHAPIILSYPDATLYQFDEDGIARTTLEQTEHFRVTRAFLSNPDRYLAELFDESDVNDADPASESD